MSRPSSVFGGQLSVRERGEGGEEIERGAWRGFDTTCRDGFRPPSDARHADAAFPGGAFAIAERAVAAAEPAVDLAGFQRRAFEGIHAGFRLRPVVAGEDDEGVFGEAERLEMVKQATGVVVEFLDAVAVEAVLGIALEGGRGVLRNMRHRVGEEQEKRPVTVSLDEVESRSV